MTLILKFPRQYPHLRERVARERYEDIWVSAITIEEAIRGAFKERDNPPRERRGTPQENAATCYQLLSWIIMEYGKYQILPYDVEAMRIFDGFTPDVRRASDKPDRQIAATAIRHGYTVVTHNMDHFEVIPNCRCVDWTELE
jgi:predicted nucleic acid-binding protein